MLTTALILSAMANDSRGSDSSESDRELLRRFFSGGEREAMEQLFLRHADMAYRVALRELQNSADAEEAVQTAFVNILTLTQVGRGSHAVDNVRGWIMGI